MRRTCEPALTVYNCSTWLLHLLWCCVHVPLGESVSSSLLSKENGGILTSNVLPSGCSKRNVPLKRKSNRGGKYNKETTRVFSCKCCRVSMWSPTCKKNRFICKYKLETCNRIFHWISLCKEVRRTPLNLVQLHVFAASTVPPVPDRAVCTQRGLGQPPPKDTALNQVSVPPILIDAAKSWTNCWAWLPAVALGLWWTHNPP